MEESGVSWKEQFHVKSIKKYRPRVMPVQLTVSDPRED